MRKVVVYMGDSRIYNQLVYAAKSLLHHTPVDQIYFLTDTPTFPDNLPPVITPINVHDQQYFRPDNPNMHPHYGYMTLMRSILSKVLPDEHVVLLLDPDTIVYGDISPLWDYDPTGYYFAAVEDIYTPGLIVSPYYNAGVMLMNLDRFRADAMDDLIIRTINAKHYTHMEQDVLNILCHDRILPLPSEYNSAFISAPCEHPLIRHFLDRAKPFLAEAQRPYDYLGWDEITYANTTERR